MKIVVDGYCLNNPGKGGYQGFDITKGVENKIKIFEYHISGTTTNNIAEYLAIVHALGYVKNNNIKDFKIYSDSMIALGWVKKGYSNTGDYKNAEKSYELLERADRLVHGLSIEFIKNKLSFWDKREHGENPADFGHKTYKK